MRVREASSWAGDDDGTDSGKGWHLGVQGSKRGDGSDGSLKEVS